MSTTRLVSFSHVVAIVVATLICAGAASAQFTVTLTPSVASPVAAPATYDIDVDVTLGSGVLDRVLVYRNDVPYKTLLGPSLSLSLPETARGQDNYTYRATAYKTNGETVESASVLMEVRTQEVFKMGTSPTHGPDRGEDHTDDLIYAISQLGSDGGTVYFPCNNNLNDAQNIYNIKGTVTIPSNVTLQGESAEDGGRCRIYWHDVATNNDQTTVCHDTYSPDLTNTSMFRVNGSTTGVRFKDLWIVSQLSNPYCYPRYDVDRVASERTTAIALYGFNGSISDVIVENVAIHGFTWGIRASTCNNDQPAAPPTADSCIQTQNHISDVRIRGYRPTFNTRHLYIDSQYAYDWDVQNLNVTTMGKGQGAVEIVNAGRPGGYSGEGGKLKFMELNCNGYRDPANPVAFCVQVQKHGGLYFKMTHHEGTNSAIKVLDISGSSRTNPDPIVFEYGVMTGEFRDPSMKLYTIGSSIFATPLNPDPATQDTGRMRFYGQGANSTVVDCGDVHWDLTNVDDPGTTGPDFQMAFTHSERYRGSFFLDSLGTNARMYVKEHKYCPADVSGVPDINTIGGDKFDTGVMPTESFLQGGQEVPYTHKIQNDWQYPVGADISDKLEQALYDNWQSSDSPNQRSVKPGAVYINGQFTISRTIRIPSGKQIIGGPDAELELVTPNIPLFFVDLSISYLGRSSGIVIRNLKLKTEEANTTGLSLVGGSGTGAVASSDMHFSGLTIEGFKTGMEGRRFDLLYSGNPMIDGVSLKGMNFVNNEAAIFLNSSNISNWNIMNLTMLSNENGASGFYQKASGNSIQGVRCEAEHGTTMTDCIKLEFNGLYLTGMKQTVNVTNNLNIGISPGLGNGIYSTRQTSTVLLRENDFTSTDLDLGKFKLEGKSNITSFNNKYRNFDIQDTWDGKKSRVTYCGDNFALGTEWPDLDTNADNKYVGVPVPTRVECSQRPMQWDEAVNWGGEPGDIPLVGNFHSATREDFVIYRPGSGYYIKQSDGTQVTTYGIGSVGDIPVIGKFFPGENSAVVAWIPSNGQWWVANPMTTTTAVWSWGMNGDRPFVGNFWDEASNGAYNDKDEIAVYRPSNGEVYIRNPRYWSSGYLGFSTGVLETSIDPANPNIIVQVGNFLGQSHQQVALYNRTTGEWKIFDPSTGGTAQTPDTISSHTVDDVPVAGNFLSGACTSLAVWRPSTQQFVIEDPAFTNCVTPNRTKTVYWGSKNNPSISSDDDIPLRFSSGGSTDRPATYRPTKGLYPESIANGQWWIRDAVN